MIIWNSEMYFIIAGEKKHEQVDITSIYAVNDNIAGVIAVYMSKL